MLIDKTARYDWQLSVGRVYRRGGIRLTLTSRGLHTLFYTIAHAGKYLPKFLKKMPDIFPDMRPLSPAINTSLGHFRKPVDILS